MRQLLLAALTFSLVGVSLALADDPPVQVAQPAQPRVIQFQPAQPKVNPFQPAQPFTGRATTQVALLRMEEEVESLEAHRDTRKAYVNAAEVAVRSAQLNYERMTQLVKSVVITREELEKAKLDVDAAKAQVDVRMAEMKEVEVKIKYAKKRLEDAKAAGVRPINPPKVDPKPADPNPQSSR